MKLVISIALLALFLVAPATAQEESKYALPKVKKVDTTEVRAADARAARVAIDAYLDRARKETTSTRIDLVGGKICDLIGEAARKAAVEAIHAMFGEYGKLGRRPADEDATN